MKMTEKELNQIFKDFNKVKVLIVGDVMIDKYIYGKVERVSPEAPVPVVDVQRNDSRLGGAGNVALNISSLGSTPLLCSVVGDDDAGKELIDIFNQNGLSTRGIIKSQNLTTTIKTRVIGNQHQLLRIDSEIKDELNSNDNRLLIQRFTELIGDVDVVIFQDYDKGVLGSANISELIKIAKESNKHTIVDPKKNNFFQYKNTDLFKPNLKEIKEGLGKEKLETIDDIKLSINDLEDILQNNHTMVTLSERGVLISHNKQFSHVPAHVRNISDVSGAGDTVVSVAALCLALSLEPTFLAEISNLSGGLVCEDIGVVPINKERLLRESIKTLTN